METDKYRALITAIDTGSLAAAAEKLGYTTSGISRMMASLESELGLSLLIRSKTGVRASSACEKILPEIRKLLESADRLGRKSASLHGTITGIVRVGTAYNYYYAPLAKAVRIFAETYPDVSFEITSGYSTALVRDLDEHRLDLCIVSRREAGRQWIPLVKDEMVAAVSSGNPLAEGKTFPVSKFAASPYIRTHPNADSDSARVFQKCGVIPNTRFTTEDSMATFSMVAADLGVTMNNRINAVLWKGGGITVLPLRPAQRIEIGVELSDEADGAVLSFAEMFMECVQEEKQDPES